MMRTLAIALGVLAVVVVAGYQYLESDPAAKRSAECLVEHFTEEGHKPRPAVQGAVTVTAVGSTAVVRDACDAADDPAIYFNSQQPEKSLILGTNKARGVNVYNLDGKELFHAPVGKVNNIDIRQDVSAGGRSIAVVGGSNKSANINLWQLDPATGTLTDILAQPIATKVEKQTYGFCLYHRKAANELYGFVTDKSGAVEQWRLTADDSGKFTGEFVRKLRVSSKTEGCVVDDASGRLFIAEEDVGIWLFSAEPGTEDKGQLIAKTGYGASDGAWLTDDIEGLALYQPNADSADSAGGFLVASSQGNDTFALFDLVPPYAYRGAFQVKDSTGRIVGDTDGIAINSASFGAKYPKGLMVIQDGTNPGSGLLPHQNFRLVSWQDITAKGVPVAH